MPSAGSTTRSRSRRPRLFAVRRSSYPVLAAARWAERAQAEDQIRVARLGVDEDAAAGGAGDGAGVPGRDRAAAAGRSDSARARKRDRRTSTTRGRCSRAAQAAGSTSCAPRRSWRPTKCCSKRRAWRCRRAQEALGVLVAADAPVDAAAEPVFEVVPPTVRPELADRPHRHAAVRAPHRCRADRVYRDSWRDWVPTATVVVRAAAGDAVRVVSAVAHLAGVRLGVRSDVRRRRAPGRRSAARDRARTRPGSSSPTSSCGLAPSCATRRRRSRARNARLINARLAAQHAAEVLQDHRRCVSCGCDDEHRAHRRAAASARCRHGGRASPRIASARRGSICSWRWDGFLSDLKESGNQESGTRKQEPGSRGGEIRNHVIPIPTRLLFSVFCFLFFFPDSWFLFLVPDS